MKLTPEIFEQNVAAYLADKAGKPWQYQLPNGKWIFTDCPEEGILWHIESWPCRPAPEPEPPKPWSLETKPSGVVWVRRIGSKWESQISSWDEGTCLVAGYANIAYSMLLSDFEQLDGSPCGVVKEAK